MSAKKLIAAATEADWAAVAKVLGMDWTEAFKRALAVAADDRKLLDLAAQRIRALTPLARLKLVTALSPECRQAVHEFYRSNEET